MSMTTRPHPMTPRTPAPPSPRDAAPPRNNAPASQTHTRHARRSGPASAAVAALFAAAAMGPAPELASVSVPAQATNPGPASPASRKSDPAPGAFTLLGRSVAQDQGAWVVTYQLRFDGPSHVRVNPSDVRAKVEGWVSNARVAAHSAPRLSTVALDGHSGLAGTCDVVPSADESKRCRERAVVRVSCDEAEMTPAPRPASPTAAFPFAPVAARAAAPAEPPPAPVTLAPGASVQIRLRLEHLHDVYGDYDPLLGARSVDLDLGGVGFRDQVALDREQYLARPKLQWPAFPDERRDDRHFLSGPDSLHLEAHVPGNQSFRFQVLPVRYGTPMRLKFAYFVARGTEGQCRVRVAQFRETANSWKTLTDGNFEQKLGVVGRWVRVEKVFRTEAESTTLELEFGVCGASVGEMWVDDVSLEPVGSPYLAENP